MTSSTIQNPLGFKPIKKLLITFAWPAITANIINALYNIIDQIFIGHGVGYLGNAATNISFPITTICLAVGLMIGIGSASNFNLELGRGNGEKAKELEDTIIKDLGNSYVQGLTLLGGEPFLNTQVALSLAKRIRMEFGSKKDIWVYSGYTYDQLLNGSEDKKELLSLCDVLVDGPFIIALKDFSLKFRGSSNQRIIDLKKSTKDNIVLYLS